MQVKLCRDPRDRQQDEPVAVCAICGEDIYEMDRMYLDSAGNFICDTDYCLAD